MAGTLLPKRISLAITPDDRQAIDSALQVLLTILLPYLVDLGPAERRSLAKMGPKTVDFVTQTLEQTQFNIELKPGFVDIGGFQGDLDAVGILRAIAQPLRKLLDMAEDSQLLSGAQAYSAALACYKAFQEAARRGVPGAERIVAILAPRFHAQKLSRAAGRARAAKEAAAQD